ncbi:MAG: hypothetical protein SVX43_20530, partial [Cyanobacteriota bacterium]|nr:hypothetical protein [Cyanobacteriota bacterium]
MKGDREPLLSSSENVTSRRDRNLWGTGNVCLPVSHIESLAGNRRETSKGEWECAIAPLDLTQLQPFTSFLRVGENAIARRLTVPGKY